MEGLILLTIVIVLISLAVITCYFFTVKSKLSLYINKYEKYEENEELIMIRYNYVINLKKLESFTNELFNGEVDDKLINHIKKYIDKLDSYIYGETYEKTINFENDLLYKTEIINLDLVFHAYEHFFKKLDKNALKLLNDKNKLKLEIEKKEKSLNKIIKTLKKRSENILKNKEDLDKYYLKIEEIKNDYKEFINKSSIITTLLFIKHGINVISEKSD